MKSVRLVVMAIAMVITMTAPAFASPLTPPIPDGEVTTTVASQWGTAGWGDAVTWTVASTLDWLEAGRQTQLTIEAVQRALQAASRPPVVIQRPATPAPAPQVSSTVGECTGFVIPAYIIQRESGGNPSAMNPSGAYGCAQTLLAHYNPGGACAGLNPYTIDGQRQCVYILSNGGTNLAPWAETR